MKIETNEIKEKELPQKFNGRFSKDGGMEFGTYTKLHLKKFAIDNPNMPFEIKPVFPESSKQRGFFEGGICPLVTFYQEGLDHRNSKDVQKIREWLKIEFNGELISINGKVNKIAQSTKRQLNLGFLERVTDWLISNYAPPSDAIDPIKYKHWKDTIYPDGGPETYIDYLIELRIL